MKMLRIFLIACLGLTPGCSQSAEGEVAPKADLYADPEDPQLAAMLATPVPSPASWPALLEELESSLAVAGNPRAGRAERVRAVEAVDAQLAHMAVLDDWRPLVRAQLLAELGDTTEVRIHLSDPHLPQLLEEVWGSSLRAQAHLVGGDTTEAIPHLRRAVLTLGPDHAESRWAAGILARTTEGQVGATSMDPDWARALGRTLLAMGRVDAGLDLITPLLQPDNEDPARDAWLHLEVARALEAGGRQTDATRILEQLIEQDEPRVVAMALDQLAGLALARGRLAQARELALTLEEVSPGSPRVGQLLALTLEQEITAGRVAPTSLGLAPLLALGIRETEGERIKVQTGTRILLAGRNAEAEAFFGAYLEGARTVSAQQQALYWLGESRLRANGDRSQAEAAWREAWELDPLSQYGLLAGDRLGAPILPNQLAPGPTPRDLEGEVNAALLRLEAHRYLPIRGSFAFELSRIQDHLRTVDDGLYALGEALVHRGFPLQGVVLGRAIHREENGVWNLRLLRIVHPFPFREAIEAAALEYGLDPFLVAGLIRQESLFQPRVRSSAGAVGLMQLMEPTAREMAQGARVTFTPASLTDPAYNVRLGSRYLAQMLSRHPDRPEDALAAYNAGPGRLRQWQSRPEYRDPSIFREHIPFRETRHYVKVVQQYARIYKALYGCGEALGACQGLPSASILELRTEEAERREPSPSLPSGP